MLTKEERKKGLSWGWWVGVAIALFVVVVVAFKVLLFPAMVVNTAANSAKGVIDKTLDSNNVIHKYEWFHDVNAQRDSRLNQIKAHSGLLSDETDKKERSRLSMELAAMQQSCRDLSTQYNANSEKVNVSIFKGSSLPAILNINDCEAK